MSRITSDAGINLVKRFEGCKLTENGQSAMAIPSM
jgi:GH24 family phage-related lysozyme (muramidase)